jgi:Glycosyltransferase like family 2
MGVTIDILVPMLGRPHQVERLIESMVDTMEAQIDLRLTFVVSGADADVLDAVREADEEHVVLPGEPEPGDYAKKINAGFRATEGQWVLLGASDLRFHPLWASTAIAVGTEYDAGVVGTNDMGNPLVMKGGHATHPLVRRSYVERWGGGWDGPGVVYHEGYHHQYVDTELVTVAQARGRWAFAHGSRVEHLHPFWKKGQMDETYRRGLASGHLDSKLFRRRARQFT